MGTNDRQDLATALTRAIPAAVSADAIWSTLPLGPVGSVELPLELDGDGKLGEPQIPPRTTEPLRLLVRRTAALMASGRFAIPEATGAGRALVRIGVELSQQPASETEGDSLRLSFQAPSAGGPGRATFTLASGRHFEATVATIDRARLP